MNRPQSSWSLSKKITQSENSHIEKFRWQKKETTHNDYVHVNMSERQTSSKRWMMNRSIKAVGCKKWNLPHLMTFTSSTRNKSLTVTIVSFLATVTCISITSSCWSSPWMLFVIYLFVWLFVFVYFSLEILCCGILFAYFSWICATLPTAMCCANVSNFNILVAKGSVHYESKDMAANIQRNTFPQTFPHFYILKTEPSALYIFQIYIACLELLFFKI